jgi:hypothetical protein
MKGESAPKKVLSLTQIGEVGYRVERTTNFLDQRVGVIIGKEKVAALIKQGVTVIVGRNK